jgi:D-aminoacyl-tRNA deacylase
MIAVIQRVSQASVEIDKKIYSEIKGGLLLLVGFEEADNDEDVAWLAHKIVNLRIFNDPAGVMNVSIRETGGDILIVSQFTLHASIQKGNRPSYIKAAKAQLAIPLYEKFLEAVASALGKGVQTGEFGADMKVALVNDGPVTILADSKNKL